MSFNRKGFITVTYIGTPDADGAAGSNVCLHAYVTNDDKAGVETSGYFNSLASRLKKGDIIMISLDNDGTAALRNYVVSSVSAGVVAIAAQNVA